MEPSMKRRGREEGAVLSDLSAKLKGDLTFSGDSILGSMCSLPHPVSRKVYHHYLDLNIGDPGLHPGLFGLEKETILMTGRLLGSKEAAGSILTGGTEANILAMWAAKRKGKKRRKVVLPETSHFSFDKAADMMDLELCKIPCDSNGRVRSDLFIAALDNTTMAAVGIAGTTGLGAVDPIEELSSGCRKLGIPFHVDAAFGGFVLPFLKEAGYPAGAFDFTLPGVESITLDPHKMGRSAIPAGMLLFRDRESAAYSETSVSYLAGGETVQQSVVGTRSGASVAAVWATMEHLGIDGYVETVKTCMERTWYLYERIQKLPGIAAIISPEMNVLGIRPEKVTREKVMSLDAKGLAEELRERGWALSLFPGFLRVTLMPHVSYPMLERFLDDLEQIVQDRS